LFLIVESIYYYPEFIPTELRNIYFQQLETNTPWLRRMVQPEGRDKPIREGRDTAVYGDGGTVYSYASVDISVMEWVEPLITIKNYVEKVTGFKFNVCLLNHYASGKEGIGWHSDKEEAGKEAPIASISLGVTRVFSFREKVVFNHTSN